MADLMNTSTVEFNTLIDKYDKFIAPSYEIFIEGKNFTKDKAIVSDIKVESTINASAGMCIFNVCNCYDYNKRSFNDEIKSMLKLGKKVKIALGYSNKNVPVFKGYIESLNFEFNENESPSIKVVCMDVMHILMQNYALEQKNKDMSLSEIVAQILDKQKAYIDKKEIDRISSTGKNIVQNISDYDFIRKIADANRFEFFALLGQVYFRKAKKVDTIITTLEFGKNIIYFNRETRYKNVKVVVMGKDDINKKTTKGQTTKKVPNAHNGFISNKIIQLGNLDSDAKAEKRAEIEAENMLKNSYCANLECIGLPEIVQGRYIKLKNFDKEFDGKYYVTKVIHEFRSGYYTTSLNLSITK